MRLARGLNGLLGRRGAVLADRYHAEILRTPRQVRHALRYVLNNARKHDRSVGLPPDWTDPCSSAAWFEGWARPGPRFARAGPRPVAEARTWLLRVGWRRWGLIRTSEVPGGRARAVEWGDQPRAAGSLPRRGG